MFTMRFSLLFVMISKYNYQLPKVPSHCDYLHVLPIFILLKLDLFLHNVICYVKYLYRYILILSILIIKLITCRTEDINNVLFSEAPLLRSGYSFFIRLF